MTTYPPSLSRRGIRGLVLWLLLLGAVLGITRSAMAQAPGQPTGLTAVPGNASISLSWTAGTGTTQIYKVKESLVSGGPYTTVATPVSTSYTRTGLTNGTTYYYVVSGVNLGLESLPSTEASATPTSSATTAPGAPASPSVTAGNAAAKITWSTPLSGGPATGYNVYRGTSNGGPYGLLNSAVIAAGNETQTVTLTNVTGGTFTITYGGQTTPSLPYNATPAAVQTALQALSSIGSNNVLVTGTAGSSYVLAFQGTQGSALLPVVTIGDSTTGSGHTVTAAITTPGSQPSYLDKPLTNGTTYYYVVTAVNVAGESPLSTQVNATPSATLGPGLTFIKQDTSTQGAYQGVYDGGLSASGGYQFLGVIPSVGNGLIQLPTAPAPTVSLAGGAGFDWSTSAALAGVNGALQQPVGATAYNVGTYASATSETIDITVPGSAPETVALYLLDWQAAPAGPNTGTARKETIVATDPFSGNVLNTQANLTNFQKGLWVEYQVTGHVTFTITRIAGGNAVVSGIFFGGGAAPGAPTLAATPGNTQIQLSWTPGTGATDSYSVYRGTAAGAESTTPIATGITTTSYNNTGLTNGVTYYYYIVGYDNTTPSPQSNEVSAAPTASAVATATFVNADTTTSGNWKGAYGADGYDIAQTAADLTNVTPGTTPPYVGVYAKTGGTGYTWTSPVPSASNGALAHPTTSGAYVAGIYYTTTTESIDLNITGATAKQVALYFLDFNGSTRAVSVTVKDAVNGTTLGGGPQTASAFTLGEYLVWKILGHVTITITRTAGSNAGVTAVFFGGGAASPAPVLTGVAGNNAVSLSWTAGTGATSYTVKRAPTATTTYTTLASGVTALSYVDLSAVNGTAYDYKVTALNASGATDSNIVSNITPAQALGASVHFLATSSNATGSSTVTNWQANYAVDGYYLAGPDSTGTDPSNPAYATVTYGGTEGLFHTNGSPADGTLQSIDGSTSIAGYRTSLHSETIDLNITGAVAKTVTLYTLDFLNGGRAETITVTDSLSGRVLDTETTGAFETGKYFTWFIRGHVIITVAATAGPNAVYSAVFYGTGTSAPPVPTGVTATPGNTGVTLSWNASAGATFYTVYRNATGGAIYSTVANVSSGTTYVDTGLLNGTTYYYVVTASNLGGESAFSTQVNATPVVTAAPFLTATPANKAVILNWIAVAGATGYNIFRGTASGAEGTTPVNASPVATLTYTDGGLTNGTKYFYTVKAISSAGTGNASNEASAIPTINNVGNAQFIGIDSTTQGAWIGTYGDDGYDLLAAGASEITSTVYPPSYATIALSGGTKFTWAASVVPASEPTALLKPAPATDALAGTLYSTPGSTETIDLNLTDTRAHTVSLYLLDWHNTPPTLRSETVTIKDAIGGTILDSQAVSNFAGGVYLTWALSGHVTITIAKTAGANAVVSGIFFGGGPAPAAPATLTATPANQAVSLNWPSVVSATGYNIYRATGVNQVDTVTVTGATGGTFTLSYGGNTTSALPWNASPAAVQTALLALASIGANNVAVTGTPATASTAGTYTITFQYGLGSQSLADVTSSGASLTPGTATVSQAITTAGASAAGGPYFLVNPSPVSTTSYTNASLTNGVQYWYVVSALANDSESPNSPVATAIPGSVAGSSATLLKTDTTTQGAWTGKYGADGYYIANVAPSLPGYISAVTPVGATAYTWATTTTDPAALQNPLSAGSNIATTYYSNSGATEKFTVNNAGTNQIAVYLLDWHNSNGRAETVSILDAANPAVVLSSKSVTNFTGGTWLVWSVTGNVIIQVTKTAGANAVLSGIFFGNSGASVSNYGTDIATKGSWIGAYGNSSTGAYYLAGTTPTAPFSGVGTTTPLAGPIAVSGTYYLWAASTTNPIALQKPSPATDRIAATWYSATSETVDLNLKAGTQHIALYLLTWDSTTRNVTVSFADAVSGQPIGTPQTINVPHGGTYAKFDATGHVLVTITKNTGPNALLSGVFVN